MDPQALAFLARNQGLVVGRNIAKLLREFNEKLECYSPMSYSLVVISLGRHGGSMELPFGIVLGGFITKLLKSKSMFVETYWTHLRLAAPD